MEATGNRDGGRTAKTKRPFYQTAAMAVVMAGVALAAAACGSADSGNTVASVPGTAAASATNNGAATTGDPVAFAKCMRENGVPNFKDPEKGKPFADGVDTNSPEFQKAQAACKDFALPAPAAPGGAADLWSPADKLKYAKCMRDNGVPNFPDPDSNGGFMLPQGVDPNQPQFKQAEQTCSKYKPDALKNATTNQPVGG